MITIIKDCACSSKSYMNKTNHMQFLKGFIYSIKCMFINFFNWCIFNNQHTAFNFIEQFAIQPTWFLNKNYYFLNSVSHSYNILMWHLFMVKSSTGEPYWTKLLKPTDILAKFVFSHLTDIPASLSFVHTHGNIASLL